MAAEILRNAGIWIREFDLQGSMNAVTLEMAVDSQECTAFGAGARQYAIGLPRVPLSISGYPKNDDDDAALFGLAGLTDLPVTIATHKTIGAVAFVGKFLSGGYSSVYDVANVRTFQGSGELSDRSFGRGRILHLGDAVDTTGDGDGQLLRAISANRRAYATLHVTAVDGTTPTLDVIIESDDNSGFTTAVTRATFAQVEEPGGQLVAISGAITDTYWRASWTVGGTSPEFSFAIALGFEEVI